MDWNAQKVKDTIQTHKVVCFGKGSKQQPMCGFTHRAIAVLTECGVEFEVINIFDDPSIRPALIEVSNWPTTPQVFVDGEFVGGSDVVLEMFESGELQKLLTASAS